MTDNTRNEFVSYGLEILKRSALLVLYEAEAAGKPVVKQDAVRQRLGIPQIDYRGTADNSMMYGILALLKADGLAYHEIRQGWSITDKGLGVIEG